MKAGVYIWMQIFPSSAGDREAEAFDFRENLVATRTLPEV